MNSNLPIEQLWDAYRDGELSQADIARFEQYLADHPDRQALFDVESQWLESLHDQPMMQKTLAAQTQVSDDFTATILDQWDDQSKPVLAKIHWKSASFSAGWLVAAAAIAIAMWVNAPEATIDQPAPRSIASNVIPSDTWANPANRHPLTSLVQDMDDTYDEKPTDVFAALGSMMNLSNVEIQPASFQEH